MANYWKQCSVCKAVVVEDKLQYFRQGQPVCSQACASATEEELGE